MKASYTTALFLFSTLTAPVLAEQSGISFEHKDWEVTCDNTLTCRTAGYASEEGAGGSVLLTRQAGANTVPTGEVILSETDSEDEAPVTKLTVWINGVSAGDLTAAENDTWRLSQPQTLGLINAVKGSGKVEFKGGHTPFMLSNDGAYAVMLKVDDVQGRIGTPGAWTKKGNKPESGVTKAVPAPVIQAAKVSKEPSRLLTQQEITALKPRLMATLTDDLQCDRLNPDEEEKGSISDEESDKLTYIPLDNTHALISTLCWRAAYNEGYGYWVIDKALTGKPAIVTDSGDDYRDGEISWFQKGRGIADCVSMAGWVWDGQTFQKTRHANSGMCRYIRAGGSWDLPDFVAEVKPAP
ncbi:DUF1176 domain-containing protein [Pantoea sp. MBD-2R]|uniref:DUF1176 domain-containing protein n=1 Tax=Pantoea sp. MBD-2R TaxID=3141540 RepID=UPI0031843EC1